MTDHVKKKLALFNKHHVIRNIRSYKIVLIDHKDIQHCFMHCIDDVDYPLFLQRVRESKKKYGITYHEAMQYQGQLWRETHKSEC
jgi:hypothetical protein